MSLRHCPRRVLLACALFSACAGPLAGQLRPLEPMDWRAFDPGTRVIGRLGGGSFFRQRVSAGQVEGRLLEAPGAVLSWSVGEDGRAVVRAIVNPLRVLRVDSSLGTPLPGTTAISDRIRDAGDNALETALRLAPAAATTGSLLALRYGVRLPTHNQRKGLDRHKTDFYALAGGRVVRAALTVAGEGGLGVFGTHAPGHDRALPFLYDVSARWTTPVLEPSLTLVGQATPTQIRGNEDLVELRAGVRIGGVRFLEATLLRGLAAYGPRWGVLVFAGVQLR